jgi:hypothetical protein
MLGWQFYAPSMQAAELQAYADEKGYGVLSEIKPSEGYWVNARSQFAPSAQSGDSHVLTSAQLAKGWSLVATGSDIAPSMLNNYIKSSAIPISLTTLWAWDNLSSKWYFYAPSLEADGTIAEYVVSKGYRDFASTNKTLAIGTGFWVNR